MSLVLTVNAGSNSLKLALVDDANAVVREQDIDADPQGDEAARALSAFLSDHSDGVTAIGHRIVQGGPDLLAHTVIDDRVLARLRAAADLAPLHVPPALAALATARRRRPDVPHVACLDTVFHRDMPEAARTYALPRSWRERFGLRRYGFHGLSYAYLAPRTAALLGREADDLGLVLCHLGGGSSVCAVSAGRSVWTSMGFTPLEGLPMVTRSGSVDPGLLLWLQTSGGLSAQEVSDGLEHDGGLWGLSGHRSKDTRELYRAAAAGDAASRLALDVFGLRLRQEIAAAAATLDRLDAVVFSGEIGTDQPELRAEVIAGLGVLGLSGLPADAAAGTDRVVSAPDAGAAVLVIRPREDLQIATETRRVLAGR